MPELPEVETVARELNRKLKNKIIGAVEVRAPKMISIGPNVVSNIRAVGDYKVKKFIKLLKGQKILSVRRRAKLLIFGLSGPWTMLVHLKMTGQFIFEDENLRKQTRGRYRLFNKLTAPKVLLPSKHTHIIFKFTDNSNLYFNDIRKFGYLKLVHSEEIDKVKDLKTFGPEPLTENFKLAYFLAAVRKYPKRAIKSILMDPKVVAGIGNIYSDEILFHAKVRPTIRAVRTRKQELKKIYRYIKSVLIKAIQAKGSSVGDFVRTDGSWGRMGKFHFVYGRAGQKCKRCKGIIKSVKLGGRSASYCPACQR